MNPHVAKSGKLTSQMFENGFKACVPRKTKNGSAVIDSDAK